MTMIRRIFSAWRKDDFARDWYGWLTNQFSHIGLGFLLAALAAGMWFLIGGEFPWKPFLWISVFIPYLALEFARGWNGIDSVEDVAFVTIYGAGSAIVLFSEYKTGAPLLVVNFSDLPWVMAIPAAHLIVGTHVRT